MESIKTASYMRINIRKQILFLQKQRVNLTL